MEKTTGKKRRPKENKNGGYRTNPDIERLDALPGYKSQVNEQNKAREALAMMKRLEAKLNKKMVRVHIPGQGNILRLATRERAVEICSQIKDAYIDEAVTVAPVKKPRRKACKTNSE